jgi:CDP-glycerol glycerophosphotransferase (TagB/SpsB family)
MKNLGVVITDGVGYRNFILSNFINEAKRQFDNVIIFSCLPKEVYEDLTLNCIIVELEVFEETFYTWFFRKAKEVTHLQLHAKDNFGIKDNLNQTKSKAINPRGIAIRFIHKWSKNKNSEKWILRYNLLQQKTFASNKITKNYIELLKLYEVKMLFFTHQRPPFIAPFIFAAEELKIKTSTFIFSWDNLASKGRMAGNFDYYLVWSDLMKKELLHFYKSVKETQIAVVGTPQFEPYVMKEYGYDKMQLCNKFKINSEKIIILFTCNDASSKNDPIYLECLAQFVSERKLIKEVNIIVRTSPVEEPARFKKIAEKYPFLVWNFPDWKVSREGHQEAWTQRVPSVTDLNDLKSLLNHCDVCINVLSTITLDAFIFDKPVINPVFGNRNNRLFDDQKFLNYAHLSKLVDSNSSKIVKNEKEYLDSINDILQFNDFNNNQRKYFLNLQIGGDLVGTSKRITDTLQKWI